MTQSLVRSLGVGLGLLACAGALACTVKDSSSSGGRPDFVSAPPLDGAAGGPPALNADQQPENFGNAEPGGSAPPMVAPQPRDPSRPPGACAATSRKAQQIIVEEEITTEETIKQAQPVALYIVLDQSGSMNTGGLWVPATDAIREFVSDPGSNGLNVALEFFPADRGEVGQCGGMGYDAPAVTMGRLPDHAANVTALLDLKPFAPPAGGGTPIEGGLRGGVGFCRQFEAANPDEECVVVLITDGSPTKCEQDASTLASIAGQAHDGGMGVRTFAVGLLGADFALLDQIATMGGALDCDEANDGRFSCDVSAGPEQLADALAKIREVVTTVETHTQVITRIEERPLECEWEIPEPPRGEEFDRDKVNVVLAGDGVPDIVFGKVPAASACGAMGWHYDDNARPTRIIACEQTCTAIQSTMGARVDIQLGCASRPLG